MSTSSPATTLSPRRSGGLRLRPWKGGIPADGGNEVFAAVQEGRFWVITHPMTKAGVKVRFDDFVEGRPPTPLSM
jgi:hypothetical protein